MANFGRSVGSRGLAKLGQTQGILAKKIGVSRVAVAQYLAGDTRPSPVKRAKIFEQFGIPVESWDQPIVRNTTVQKTTATTESVSAETAEPPSIIAKVKELQAMVYALMAKLSDDQESTYQEQAKAMSSLAQTLAVLTKLLGQDNLGSRIFKLPIWKQIESALQRGLEGHPKAAASVAAELRRAEQELS